MHLRCQVSILTSSGRFSANLYSLPEHREDYTLEAAVTKEFQRFGVVFVKIRRDTNGMPFAFVQFTVSNSTIASITTSSY